MKPEPKPMPTWVDKMALLMGTVTTVLIFIVAVAVIIGVAISIPLAILAYIQR